MLGTKITNYAKISVEFNVSVRNVLRLVENLYVLCSKLVPLRQAPHYFRYHQHQNVAEVEVLERDTLILVT